MSKFGSDFVQKSLSDDEEIDERFNTKSGSVLVVAGEQPRQYRFLVVDSEQKEITEIYIENIIRSYPMRKAVSLGWLDRLRGFRQVDIYMECETNSSEEEETETISIVAKEDVATDLHTKIHNLREVIRNKQFE